MLGNSVRGWNLLGTKVVIELTRYKTSHLEGHPSLLKSEMACDAQCVQLVQILERTVSTDQRELEGALQYLKQTAETNLPEFLKALSDVLHNGANSRVTRMAAGLQLKNHLVAKDALIKKAYQERWMTIPEEIRTYIKNNILQSLGTEDTRPSSAAQCVACVAVIEVPCNQWPSVITTLTRNVTEPGSSETEREASLEAIGYICHDIDPDVLMSQSNEILTAIVHGMRSHETSNHLCLVATNALLNSLRFTAGNFEKEVERNCIMEVVCETTQLKDNQVRKAALECLVEIMSLYYHHMEPYMGRALFPITFEAMKSDVNDLSLQGLEFWSTVAELEIELQDENDEAEAIGQPPARTSKFYAAGALPYIVPVVLSTLTKQEEVDDEDDWNPSKAAGVCLGLLTKCCEEKMAPLVLPFIQQHIMSADWRYRDAAVMAFGSAIESLRPSLLQPFDNEFNRAISTLIESMYDKSVVVRDSAAWTFSRVCKVAPEVIVNGNHLQPVLEALIHGLKCEPRVAVNACWAFTWLAEACYEKADAASSEDELSTYILSPFFDVIVQQVVETTVRPDGDKSNLRSAAYEALMELIKRSPKDCYATVQKITVTILDRLCQVLGMEHNVQSHNARAEFTQLQGLLCATLQSVLSKMTRDDASKIADSVMTALLQIFSAYSDKSGSVQEDAIMAVGALVDVMEEDFKKYMPAFKPFLVLGLSSRQDYQVCCAAIGLTGDIFRSLKGEALPYSDEVMAILLATLADPNVHRSVKPETLSVFGEIALGIGHEFGTYLEPVLLSLQQASEVQVDMRDYDLHEWAHELNKAVMVAYSGIIQGLKSDDPNASGLAVFERHVPSIVQFTTRLATDCCVEETETRTWAGLVGDLSSFGTSVASLLDVDTVRKRLSEGCTSTSRRTRKVSLWATKRLQENQPGSLASGDADRMEMLTAD